MTLSAKQLAQYQRDGFLLLDHFADEASCDRLRARAEELVRQFDPQGLVSVFSTHDQHRNSDAYFLESGGKIHFFFEEHAFLPNGLAKTTQRAVD